MNWKKTFAIIWTGQLFSILTSTTINFAIIIWLSIETGSASVLALASVFALLPQSVIGLFSGVIIDYVNKKKIMILADVFIALCTLVLAAMFYYGGGSIWQIYLLLALRSIGSAFHAPALQAAIPVLAPEDQLMRISGINQSLNSVCNIAGPALGALLISVMDISMVMLFDVAGALIACGLLLFITIPNPAGGKAKLNFVNDIKEGLKVIARNRGILWLLFLSMVAVFFIMPISALFPLMTLKHFNGDAFMMSIVEAAWGIGMLIAGAFLGIQKRPFNKVIMLNLANLVLGVSFVLSGLLSPGYFYGFVALTLIGGMSGVFHYSSFTVIIQTNIEPAFLGRVFSVYMSVTIIPSVLGLLGTGFIADLIGITNSFIIAGVVFAIIGIISFMIPSVMNLEKKPSQVAEL